MGSREKWKDYYQLLGISKTATEEQIRKSYLKLALKVHPDKNKDADAEERFKEIGEAHETLTDKFKRLNYDFTYELELQKRVKCKRPDPFFEMNNNNDKRKKPKTYHYYDENLCFYPNFQSETAEQDPPILYDLSVTLEEIFRGCTKKMKITRTFNKNDVILRTENKIFDISVKVGWKAGTKITFSREGNRYPYRIPADIIFVIKEEPHSTFIRNDCDLRYLGKITVDQALFNRELEVPLISGGVKKFPYTVDEIQEVFTKHLKGHGLPKSKSPTERGDLIAEFHFVFENQKDGGREILLEEIREFRQRRS